MEKVKEWTNTVIAVTCIGLRHIITGDAELIDKYLDGSCMEDNGMAAGDFPTEPGIYVGTLEYWFQQGYFEGYPADGESDVEFGFSNYVKINPLTAPRAGVTAPPPDQSQLPDEMDLLEPID